MDPNVINTADSVIKRLKDQGLKKKRVNLGTRELAVLIDASCKIILQQPMLVEMAAPVRIFGDLHGQFKDLLRAFDLCGWPSDSTENQTLFLGDYVDRGRNGIETMTLLLALKVRYPKMVYLLRGNHECAEITRVYGFFDECKRRYSEDLWKAFIHIFNCLPVAAYVSKCILCMHGGLSPQLEMLDSIRKIGRPLEIPAGGLMCDLLWSDPDPALTTGWGENVRRGISFCFAEDVVHSVCKQLKLDLIVRAHQVVPHGYEFFGEKNLVTLFTAPNYCGQFDNDGAILSVDKNLEAKFILLNPQDPNKKPVDLISI